MQSTAVAQCIANENSCVELRRTFRMISICSQCDPIITTVSSPLQVPVSTAKCTSFRATSFRVPFCDATLADAMEHGGGWAVSSSGIEVPASTNAALLTRRSLSSTRSMTAGRTWRIEVVSHHHELCGLSDGKPHLGPRLQKCISRKNCFL